MIKKIDMIKKTAFNSLFLITAKNTSDQSIEPSDFSLTLATVLFILVLVVLILAVLVAFSLKNSAAEFYKLSSPKSEDMLYQRQILKKAKFSSGQIARILKRRTGEAGKDISMYFLIPFFLSVSTVQAQIPVKPDGSSLLGESGVIITLLLILLPVLLAMLLLMARLQSLLKIKKEKLKNRQAEELSELVDLFTDEDIETLSKRKQALDFSLSNSELSGTGSAYDLRGLMQITPDSGLPAVSVKKKAVQRPGIDKALSRLILYFLGSAVFWLVFGTTVGEYLGIKFIAPDADHLGWLSFGRLRPVHTNAVFWGWASLGMIGLGYYIVPRVSNVSIASVKLGWYSLLFINTSVLTGSISLMAGINNGGGEYREYIWPIMLLFGLGLGCTFYNFFKTIENRKTEEIYISNWYIVSALIFITVVALIGYLPWWQNGLGETIVQGYYMHQAVGMWFMFFTLGIVYYFLPQQLNKPIYSYSLGILAFWSQILFYTLIGTHHFVFSAIPWWLQTVAIVASAGMIIPVVAGTTNFLMTFRGAFHKTAHSYTLPFFLVGIVFYFTGSLQGTAEAFRFTNLLWHFTDFTVAHSHMTMYGIITFFLWAAIYAVIPRLTGREASQLAIGVHFWMAFIGMLFYIIPLMYGGTLRGLAWMEGVPFIETVRLMMPYWLWRAIGGSLMWVSHLIFAYNFYIMVKAAHQETGIEEKALQNLENSSIINTGI